MRQLRLAEIWDVLLALCLFPLVVGLGAQLPGDWANHQGSSLPGTAVVTGFDQVRGGDVVLVDVRDQSGRLVTRRHEVNGEAPKQMGAAFAVTFLPVEEGEDTQVYVAGFDPFGTNVAVFVPVLLVWLFSLPFALAKTFRAAGGARRRLRTPPKGQYQAGRGYVDE